jgi:Rps23 Pro-64 3,4-dihydroxylase Tpa1-like proline 4-hydroxylase
LLFDYSIASDGYYNDIHRDSDSRVIVFLLYLNTINSSGGSLSFYKKKGNQFELVETIKPMPGRLVIFLNEDHSYHGVDIMKETSGSRNFLYGSFTSLNFENPFIKEKKIRTEFNMYE